MPQHVLQVAPQPTFQMHAPAMWNNAPSLAANPHQAPRRDGVFALAAALLVLAIALSGAVAMEGGIEKKFPPKVSKHAVSASPAATAGH